jgi:hypothetical protein
VAGRECDEIGKHRLALLLREIVPLREFGSHLLQRDGYCRPRLWRNPASEPLVDAGSNRHSVFCMGST